MTGITLQVSGDEVKTINYEYKCREESLQGANEVSALIPAIKTRAALRAEDKDAVGYVREGYAFSPMFTLGGSIWQGKTEFQMPLLLSEGSGYRYVL